MFAPKIQNRFSGGGGNGGGATGGGRHATLVQKFKTVSEEGGGMVDGVGAVGPVGKGGHGEGVLERVERGPGHVGCNVAKF